MESLSPLVIELLRLEYRLSDQAIAERCGVTRVYINYVLHGKRQVSAKLENALDTLLAECDRHGWCGMAGGAYASVGRIHG